LLKVKLHTYKVYTRLSIVQHQLFSPSLGYKNCGGYKLAVGEAIFYTSDFLLAGKPLIIIYLRYKTPKYDINKIADCVFTRWH